MKRPLFWAISMFVLGEVVYIYADRIIQKSIALAMLICLAIIFVRKPKLWIRVMGLFLAAISGFVYIMYRDVTSPLMYKDMVAVRCEKAYDKYLVESWEPNKTYQYVIKQKGRITEIKEDEDGVDVVIRINATMSADYKIIKYNCKDKLRLGDRVIVSGKIESIEPAANLGVMDRVKYNRSKGIFFTASNDTKIQVIKDDNNLECWYYKLLRQMQDLKKKMGQQLTYITDETTAGFYRGILLGEKQYIDEYTGKLYQLNGIGHILVISGLHVSLVGGMMFLILNWMGIPHSISMLFSIFSVTIYGAISGFSMATVRAIIMLIISMVGRKISRDYDMLTGMNIALLIILLIEPFRILDGGVLLSFAAILGVAFGGLLIDVFKLGKRLKKKQKKYAKALEALIMTFAVNLVTAPIVGMLFYQIPIYGCLLNMLIIPLMSPLLILGFGAIALSLVEPVWGFVLFIPVKYILRVINVLCQWFSDLPFSLLNTGKGDLLVNIIYYGAIILIIYIVKIKKKSLAFKLRLIALTILCTTVWIGIRENQNKCAMIYFADVGQGDGIFIKTMDDVNMVVDGGSTDNRDLGEYTIVPVLKYHGMSQVDYWFVSHGDTDHISGLMYILEQKRLSGIEIENVVVGRESVCNEHIKEMIALCEKQSINVIYMSKGDCFIGSNWSMSCLAPAKPKETKLNNETNALSMVLLYEYEDSTVLLTGDIDKEGIEKMPLTKKVNILKIPHHGSRSSFSDKIYKVNSGEVAIISCGKDNSYGHPHREIIETLIKYGIDTYRTDISGGVKIIFR